ncbi:MAG: PQQ-binding-like beta-propeller repeat protein [Planctomycetales bacterium]|nr:PQQ-binding-like beta-propeller repeat protein [Planctomycetales bacterium]
MSHGREVSSGWKSLRFWLVLSFLIAVVDSDLRAGDWPQILGPNRNGIAVDEKLTESLPEAGPKTVWSRPVGSGFAGVAVAKSIVVLFHRQGDDEVVEALDAATGQPRWKTPFPTSYGGGYSDDHGPRCVPVIDNDRVFVFGAAGNLHCVTLADGKKIWSRAAAREFNAPESYFGAGSTPVVEAGKLIVNVGGKGSSGLVAFDVNDGHTVWQATDEQASYSSPVSVTLDGVRHVIFVTRLNATSIDPDSGTVRFRFPFGQRGPTVNAATPVIVGDHVFLTASYGIGAVSAKIGKTDAKVAWSKPDVMSSQYTTPIVHAGNLYGIDGRADIPPAHLRCVDPKTGRVLWSKDDFGKATLILADEKLVIVKTDGTLVLAKPSPSSYRELGRAKILSSTSRALPALANGLLFVRDTDTLKCVDLRK